MENNNIVQTAVRIIGTRPLWQHQFGPDALPLQPREKTGVAGNDPEEWRKTCLVTPNGRLFVRGSYLFAAIREGGRYIKSGRRTLMLAIAATLQVLDEPIYLNRTWPDVTEMNPFDPATAVPPTTDPAAPVYLDIRGVRNPSTRARNIRYRVACAPGWELQFTIQYDRSIVSREQMHSALWHAGKLVGIGNGRSIGMGRFDVAAFEMVD